MIQRGCVLWGTALAHGLAWAAFLWLVFWPLTDTSASFIEVTEVWVVLYFLIPVVLTGLAFLTVWYWNPTRGTRTAILWAMAALLLVFCVLGMLSYGILFVPAFLASATTAVVSMFTGKRGVGNGAVETR